jgi:hypothetical protein
MKYISLFILSAILVSCSGKDTKIEQTPVQQENISIESENTTLQNEEFKLDLKDSEIVYITLDSDNTEITSDAIQVSGQIVTIKKS